MRHMTIFSPDHPYYYLHILLLLLGGCTPAIHSDEEHQVQESTFPQLELPEPAVPPSSEYLTSTFRVPF